MKPQQITNKNTYVMYMYINIQKCLYMYVYIGASALSMEIPRLEFGLKCHLPV